MAHWHLHSRATLPLPQSTLTGLSGEHNDTVVLHHNNLNGSMIGQGGWDANSYWLPFMGIVLNRIRLQEKKAYSGVEVKQLPLFLQTAM